nr:hypothetical protein [Tanacetum cinerariifolium]
AAGDAGPRASHHILRTAHRAAPAGTGGPRSVQVQLSRVRERGRTA